MDLLRALICIVGNAYHGLLHLWVIGDSVGVIVPYSYLMFALFHKYLKTLEFCGRYFGKLMIHDLQIMLVFALSESFSVIY